MPAKPKILLSWSSGKDSAWTLHTLRQNNDFEVVGLLTTVNEAFDRVAMHAVRRELLEAQAQATELPLITVNIPYPCSNDQYETAMLSALSNARTQLGITHVAFGDLYLEDVRKYRERQIHEADLTPVFPIWGQATDELAEQMIDAGLCAYLTCIDPRKLPHHFAGKAFDRDFLDKLPKGVDPCGESGEFHTFTWDGPMFKQPIPVQSGIVTERDGFVFADLKLREQ